jgi:mono/diheme cytochrome c family protein
MFLTSRKLGVNWLWPFSLPIALVAFQFATGDQPNKSKTAPIDFARQIRPILSENCFRCHGPDHEERKAKLRLDIKASAFGKLRSGGRAIVPGNSKKSELVARITDQDPSVRMPPAKINKHLTPEQIELLRQWIDQGAQWHEHWAFVPPTRPALPKVKKKDWPRNGIDYFILARLAKEGLNPSPEADRTTLIRRISLDLTGLPPTPAEVNAFLADKSDNAYETVVDRLLN